MPPLDPLRAPFPYFGSKRAVAGIVWRAFGPVPNYVEPFAGSLAVLLERPDEGKYESINDLDCFVGNFWRSIQVAPEEVARHADWPVNEADLHARNRWLLERDEFRRRMHSDPAYFDPLIAGWWVWGVSTSISGEWPCAYERSSRPRMTANASGAGVHATGALRQHSLVEWCTALARRLRRVRVACGDWSRVLSGFVTGATYRVRIPSMSPCGVFLDPPYGAKDRKKGLYGEDDAATAHAVREWAIEHGDDPHLRIALCGYADEHPMPESWRAVAWKTLGGYGRSGDGGRGAANAGRERIWLSPACLPVEDTQGLLEHIAS